MVYMVNADMEESRIIESRYRVTDRMRLYESWDRIGLIKLWDRMKLTLYDDKRMIIKKGRIWVVFG